MGDATDMEHDAEGTWNPGSDIYIYIYIYIPPIEKKGPEGMPLTPKKSLGEIPLHRRTRRCNNYTRRYRSAMPSNRDPYISAKDFTSIYMKEELLSIPYNYFNSYTSRHSCTARHTTLMSVSRSSHTLHILSPT